MQPDEYRKMADVEDSMWYYRALHRNVVQSLVKYVEKPNARVLDAGCGTGGLLKRIRAARPEWRLWGLDFSTLAVELARERFGDHVVEGSVTTLPFDNESFDAISTCDVVCQVSDPSVAVTEFLRCLKPGGVLVMTMPAYQWLYSYHDREVGNLRRYSRKQVAALLQPAGFQVLVNTYWNMLPFPLAVLRRKVVPPKDGKSDVSLFPAPVEKSFNLLMLAEHRWLGRGGYLPFGSSVLTVAKKLPSLSTESVP